MQVSDGEGYRGRPGPLLDGLNWNFPISARARSQHGCVGLGLLACPRWSLFGVLLVHEQAVRDLPIHFV